MEARLCFDCRLLPLSMPWFDFRRGEWINAASSSPTTLLLAACSCSPYRSTLSPLAAPLGPVPFHGLPLPRPSTPRLSLASLAVGTQPNARFTEKLTMPVMTRVTINQIDNRSKYQPNLLRTIRL